MWLRIVSAALILQPGAWAVTVAIGVFTATPSTISFQMTDPDVGSVNGNAPAIVSWTFLGVSLLNTPWNLKVHAATPQFTGCTQIPLSAVKAKCTSAAILNILGGSATCNGEFTLTTTPTQLASGLAAVSLLLVSYTARIDYSIDDSWKYVPSTCPLSLTYTLSVD